MEVGASCSVVASLSQSHKKKHVVITMGKQRTIILIGTLALAVAISAVIGFVLFRGTKQVYVANDTIPVNTKVTSDMLTARRINSADLPDKALTKKSEILNHYTSLGVTKGGVFTVNNMADKADSASDAVAEGMSQLAIKSDNLPSKLAKGDRVNVIISASTQNLGNIALTYQGIYVTDIYYDGDNAINGVEVLVSPEQAQKIVYAMQNGTISVALVNSSYKAHQMAYTDETAFLDTSDPATATAENDGTDTAAQADAGTATDVTDTAVADTSAAA